MTRTCSSNIDTLFFARFEAANGQGKASLGFFHPLTDRTFTKGKAVQVVELVDLGAEQVDGPDGGWLLQGGYLVVSHMGALGRGADQGDS